MLAHVPSFGRNPRGSPDFLAYPVPKACMHVLGTRVPRRLGVARSASSPKAAQALGCSLTPGLRISFGRVTCMARAASVPGLWALGFLLLACVCGWVRVAVGRGFCLPLPVVAGLLGGCVWARFVVLSLFCRLFVVFVVGLWCRPAFGTCVVPCAFPLPPAVSGSGVRCGRACWARVSAVPRPSWLCCRVVFFAFFFCFFFFPVAGCPCPGPCGLSPRLLSFGLGCWLSFFFCVCLFRCPFSWWAAVPGLVLPVLPGWSPCTCFGVLSSLPSGWGVWPPSVLLAGGLVAVGCFRAPPPPFFFFWGGGGGGQPGRSSLCLPSAGVCSVAGVWCGWSLATPGGGSCVLLPATPGWVSLPVVVGGPRHSWLGSAGGGGVWCVAVVCWWGCGWCVVWLVPRHSWRRFLCATPRHSWLGFAAAGGGRSPPFLAGVCRRRWCVVRGGGVLVGLWLVCGVVGPSPLLAEVPVCYSPPLLAGFRCRWWWAVPATSGWGPLAAVVCGVWCVVCGVWRWCVGGVVAAVWCGWSLATPGGGSCVLLPATPGWVSLPVVVGGPRHSLLGSACGGGVWCVVCGVWCVVVVCWWGCGWCVVWLVPRHSWRRFLCATPRHSWLGFAAGGGGRSPPLLAGVPLRRWCVVCGVWRWCVGGVVAGVWCGWSLATPGGGSCVLLPATPGWVSLPVVVGGPRHSWLGSAGGIGVWCVAMVCCWGCGWSLATPGGGPCVLLPATPGWVSLPVVVGGPRHSWLGSAGGVGVWCVAVVCCWGCGLSLATPGGGSCVLLPATPGWVSLPLVVGGPRHSWLGSPCGGGVWCVVCGGGVLVGLWLVCGVVGPSPLVAEVRVCYSPPLLAGFRCRWWWAVPATPGWGPLAASVCGVLRWCVVGVVVGPSPLLAEVPVCYSPPLLAGFRCRWWWAVPATPGWGPLAAVVCGVWCVAVVCWWGCGWCVVWLVPRHSWRRFLCATPRHSWLGFAAAGGGRSPPLLAGVRWRRRCVVCCGGVLLGLWLVPRHSWRRSLCATPRHSWLGFAAGGGGRSPPLLAGVRWRRWCVVCGVWCLVCCWGPSPLLFLH